MSLFPPTARSCLSGGIRCRCGAGGNPGFGRYRVRPEPTELASTTTLHPWEIRCLRPCSVMVDVEANFAARPCPTGSAGPGPGRHQREGTLRCCSSPVAPGSGPARLSTGRHLRWPGRQLRPVQRQRREGRALPVRCPRPARARAGRAARVHRPGLARLPARRPARPALRLPRLRALRPEGGPPLQSSQAAARPLRQAAGRPAPLERRPFRLPRRRAARGPRLRYPGQCARHAQMPGGRHGVHLGQRQAVEPAVARERALRDAPARLHHAASQRARPSCAAPAPAFRCRR